MSNFTTAAMNALDSANEADDQRAAAAHRRAAEVYAKLDIADAIRTTAPKTPQDVPRCPHADEQAESGQVDGDEARRLAQLQASVHQLDSEWTRTKAVLTQTVQDLERAINRAEKAEAEREELEFRVQRADDLVAELRKHVDCQTRRAERVESERDEAAKLSHRYRNERDGILSELEVCGTHRDIRDLINRHTPESDQ